MQKQIKKKKSTAVTNTEVKSSQLFTQERHVRILVRACCGCGCEDLLYEGDVPFDSPLQDLTLFKYGDEYDKYYDHIDKLA